MKKLVNKANVTAATTPFPYGDVRDKTPSLAGTLWDREMMSDVLQFFEKLMDESAITANGSFDSVTDGFQLFEALKVKTRGYKVIRGVLKDGSFTELENDTGATITYSKVGADYKLTSNISLFTDEKTHGFASPPAAGTGGTFYSTHFVVDSATVLEVKIYGLDSSGATLKYGSQSGFITPNGKHLEIRVYP